VVEVYRSERDERGGDFTTIKGRHGKTMKRKNWSLSGVGTGVESSYSVDGIISRQGDVENIRMLEVLASPEPRQDSEFQVGPVEVRKSGSDSAVGGDGGE